MKKLLLSPELTATEKIAFVNSYIVEQGLFGKFTVSIINNTATIYYS